MGGAAGCNVYSRCKYAHVHSSEYVLISADIFRSDESFRGLLTRAHAMRSVVTATYQRLMPTHTRVRSCHNLLAVMVAERRSHESVFDKYNVVCK